MSIRAPKPTRRVCLGLAPSLLQLRTFKEGDLILLCPNYISHMLLYWLEIFICHSPSLQPHSFWDWESYLRKCEAESAGACVYIPLLHTYLSFS
jgi:hypothetical protein